MKLLWILCIIIVLFCGYGCIQATYHDTDVLSYPLDRFNISMQPACYNRVFAGTLAQMNHCYTVNVENQPNCTIYRECLIAAKGSYDAYQLCLPQTFQVNVLLTQNKTFSYYVDVFFNDPTCTSMPIQPTIEIFFGCYKQQFYDANMNLCPIVQVIDGDNTFSACDVLPSFLLNNLLFSGI